MAQHNLTELFSDIADSIRAKTGSNGLIVADDFPTAIDNLPVAEEYDGTVELPPVLEIPIGGKIFLDNGANGATYKFYDTSKNEITYTDISSLTNAVYYSVEGTPSKDRFYVIASDSNQADYNSDYGVNLSDYLYWGYYGITTGATDNTIGSGKTNTAQILAIPDTSGYYEGSIWEWLNDVNTNEYGGCSDWFIGSKAEYDALISSGKAGSLFGYKYLWPSVEYDSNYAYYWNPDYGKWSSGIYRRDNSGNVVAFRAF